MPTTDEVVALLGERGLSIAARDRLGNDSGDQLRLTTGQVISVYDKGTFQVQGKNREPVLEALTEAFGGGTPAPTHKAPSRKVFVVYGHDESAKTSLESMLRKWNLEPLILDQLPSGGQTIIEKLEHYRGDAAFAVVLATPDDEGHKREKEDEKAYRARQNVVLELGMMLAILGRPKVAILMKEQEKMERPSDIQGLIYMPYKNSVSEIKLTLAQEMNAQGLYINLKDV